MKIRDYNENDRGASLGIFRKYWTDQEFLNELMENLDKLNMPFYVAEKDGVVVGIAGFRKAPEYLLTHAETANPAELYIVASVVQNAGIGAMLVQKVIKVAKEQSYTEIECYSPETHDSSWKFYEKMGFKNCGIITDPEDGYPGVLWRKIL